MRQAATVADEPHLVVRSLSLDYERGSEEAPHTHPWAQLLYASRGTLRASIGAGVWLVPPRRAVWIPPLCRHRLAMLGPVQLRTLYVREHLFDGDAGVRVIDVDGLLHELVLRVCALSWLDDRVPHQRLLVQLLAAELAQAPSHSVFLTMPVDRRALGLARALLAPGAQAMDLDAAIEAGGMSRRTAERLFAKETGLSPARWYRLARLARALEHLMAGGRVDDAAAIAGYRSLSAFGDVYVKTFGVSPSAQRGVVRPNAPRRPPEVR
jgi:AraC-like DNA-binding protein